MITMNENIKWFSNNINNNIEVGSENYVLGYAAAKDKPIANNTLHYPVSRKRWRDSHLNDHHDQLEVEPFNSHIQHQDNVYLQIMHQHQLEIDRLIALQNKKLRLGIGEMKERHATRMNEIMEEEMLKTWKVKEEEIARIEKLNYVLEERVRSLFVENQVLKQVAENSEATANALRGNLERLLEEQQQRHNLFNDIDEEAAESYCNADNMELMLTTNDNKDDRICKSCGEMESCVLLLPCRHLSLCKVCGSSVHVCPVCNTPNTTSVHVIFSSSSSASYES